MPLLKSNPALDHSDPAARREPGRTAGGEQAAGPCRLGRPALRHGPPAAADRLAAGCGVGSGVD